MRGLVRRSTVVSGIFVLAGCVAPAQGAGDEPTASEAEAVDTIAPDEGIAPNDPDFTFFLAGRARDGYVVRALNGRRQRCADGWTAESCFVSSIDLAPGLFGAADSKTVLAEIGRSAQISTIALVGKLGTQTARGGRVGVLHAWEVWRAPEPRPLVDRWLHVSHQAQQALLVNRWAESNVTRIDFGWSPEMDYCQLVDGEQQCGPSHQGVMEDAIAPAGLLIDGWQDGRGVVHVNQYFLRINVGQARLPNGFWYCSATQTTCDDGDCVPEAPLCNVQSGHGRGLLQYLRTSATVVQPWLVDTTQLTEAETKNPGFGR